MKPVYEADFSLERQPIRSRCFIIPEEPNLAIALNPPHLIQLWDSRVPKLPVQHHQSVSEIGTTALLKAGNETKPRNRSRKFRDH